jgi:hypothetical protein
MVPVASHSNQIKGIWITSQSSALCSGKDRNTQKHNVINITFSVKYEKSNENVWKCSP